jgi:hypothetical protein
LLAIGSLGYTLLARVFVPPHEWDEIAYHMALAKIYALNHRIVYVPFIVHSNWPMNTEMVFSLGLLLGSELVAHLVTWWMSLWTALGIYLIGRQFMDRRVGWLGATLFLTVPFVLRFSGTGLIDLSLPFYGTAAILSYAHYREGRALSWVGLCGLLSGLAAGSKLMGGAYPLIIGLLITLNSLSSPRLAWRALLVRLGLLGSLGLLMVGPWYLRSYVMAGNPIWPFLYQILGGKNWDQLGDEYHMQSMRQIWTAELRPTPAGLLRSLYYLFFDPARLGGFHDGLGQVLLALATLSIPVFAFFRKIPSLVFDLLLLSGLYYLMWFFLVSHQVRFLAPLLPALALLGSFAFFALWDWLSRPLLQWAIAGALVFFLARDFPLFDANARGYLGSQLHYLTGQISREAYLDDRVDVMPIFRYINSELPPSSQVLLLPYETRGYYLDRAYFWGHPMSQRVIRFEQYDDPAELARDLQAMGITHVLDSPTWLYDGLRHWEHDRALMLALEAQCGERLLELEDKVLYRLVKCSQ